MFSDERLVRDVLAELAWDPSIAATKLGVTAKDGIVTLAGPVDGFAQKQAA
ncbi:BON domain-containing protein [Methylobacterium sp. J-077]|uniref:BON domain-containing protein n=1 Tax=Methylobacterium sp. J-077 TaxID=2836656 RepID=UPI001FB8C0DF|nr:BON domain-containing protein [Methylobacterium sp. J-077]MCJ2121908.1 BON domain-containing protein [Methylobacterium sp. J-077]